MTFTNTTALKIEYGAGNMASADVPNKHHQVVTEYRGVRELKRVYGRKGAGSPNGIPGAILDATDRSPGTKDLIMKSRNVRVSFGVDATERSSTKGLGKAWCLRFTNPNMGDEDIQRDLEAIGPSDLTGKGLSTGNLEVAVNDASGAGCSATSTPNIKHLQKELSDLRNMYLLYGFFSNAQTNLENGGKLELVLKSKFFDAWLLEHLAENFGYRLTKTDKDY